ncbi:MAG: purine nucleosidase [Gammaproteobacteria bacterium]
MPHPIIIDTDPGQDDAIAILLALASPELSVLGLTTVAGNVPLTLTTANALRLCELAQRPDIPVFAGCERPLVRTPVTAENVHGHTGLDGAGLPPPTISAQPQHAVDWLIDTLKATTVPITLCPLGPLTNIATAFKRAPAIRDNVKQIIAMAGAVRTHGNISPAAEFNVFADPHAADIVMRSGCSLTIMPLDVTHQALVTAERLAQFQALPEPMGSACHGMLSFYYRPNEPRFGTAGSPLHDPCVIAYLINPQLFSGKHVNVQVETTSELSLGMTVGDWWGSSGRAANCTVMQDIDVNGVFALILERIGSLAHCQLPLNVH